MKKNEIKKKQEERAIRMANQKRQTLVSISKFLHKCNDEPLHYFETANEIYMLRTLGNIFDYTINRLDDNLNLSDFDVPTKKLMRKLTDDLDLLLDRLLKYSIDTFGEERQKTYGDKSHEYGQMADISLGIRDIILHFLMFFVDEEDKWRQVELNKFFNNIVTEDAKKVKADACKADFLKLYGNKMKEVDEFLATHPEININK